MIILLHKVLMPSGHIKNIINLVRLNYMYTFIQWIFLNDSLNLLISLNCIHIFYSSLISDTFENISFHESDYELPSIIVY